MSDPLFVSFYTPEYEVAAANLVKSLRKFKLHYRVVRMLDRGSWQANCHIKPGFIWGMIEAHPGRPIVWVDADAEIIKPPTLFTEEPFSGDVGICRWQRPDARPETLSGTVYFKGTPNSARVVDRWIEACQESPEIWDQVLLERAVDRVPEAVVEILPLEYCWIFDTFRKLYPTRWPVIEHHQLSRKTRFKVPK